MSVKSAAGKWSTRGDLIDGDSNLSCALNTKRTGHNWSLEKLLTCEQAALECLCIPVTGFLHQDGGNKRENCTPPPLHLPTPAWRPRLSAIHHREMGISLHPLGKWLIAIHASYDFWLILYFLLVYASRFYYKYIVNLQEEIRLAGWVICLISVLETHQISVYLYLYWVNFLVL